MFTVKQIARLLRGVHGLHTLMQLVHLDLYYLMGVIVNLYITDGIPIAKYTSYSSAKTEAFLKSSSEIILWRLKMLLKGRVDMEN